jgi:hypothetical protein
MLRSLFAQALPVMSTVAAVLYVKDRKGLPWAIAAGMGAHMATTWLAPKLLNLLDGDAPLPAVPVTVKDGVVEVPPLTSSAEFAEVAPLKVSKAIDVIDKQNNIIRLPSAIGE